MHIVVFTRSTPDTAAKVEVGANGQVGWGDASTVVNPWDEYALEEAINQAKAGGGTATVIALGGDFHADALKHALAMGIDNAIRIDDPALTNADPLALGSVMAAAVQKLGDVDLVLFGREAVDLATDLHIAAAARKLGWPLLSLVSKIIALDSGTKTIRAERQLEQGRQTVSSRLPAVLSVTKEINEPRYPSFIGIRKASKATIPVWSLADLGMTLPAAKTQVSAYRNPPARALTTEMITGTPQEMAATLVSRLIEEKVL